MLRSAVEGGAGRTTGEARCTCMGHGTWELVHCYIQPIESELLCVHVLMRDEK